MYLNLVGVLSDYQGRVLLQQLDHRALLPVHCPLAAGAPPADTLARAFREQTGLIVLPLRLTALHYRAGAAGDELAFYFRCIMRGGELHPPDGHPAAGFFESSPLPRALSPRFRQPVAATLSHAGGPPLLMRETRGAGRWLRRLLDDRPAATGVDEWAMTIRVLARWTDGRVLWTRHAPSGPWRLPAATPAAGEAPWAAAERLLKPAGLHDPAAPKLSLVALAATEPAMTLLFDVQLGENDEPSRSELFTVANVPTEGAAFDPDDEQLLAHMNDDAAPTFITPAG